MTAAAAAVSLSGTKRKRISNRLDASSSLGSSSTVSQSSVSIISVVLGKAISTITYEQLARNMKEKKKKHFIS